MATHTNSNRSFSVIRRFWELAGCGACAAKELTVAINRIQSRVFMRFLHASIEGAASLHFPEMPVNYPAVVGVKLV